MISVVGSAFQEDILFAFGGGDSRIKIAVLDGPVDRTHDCFRGARLMPVDTAVQAADGNATAHGTHIASLIFGQPCSSIEGIAPLCRGLIVPIFGDDRPGCTQRELARAILLAVDHGAHVINVGMRGFVPSREMEPILTEALDHCRLRNVLIVAAGGGEGGEYLNQAAVLEVNASDEAGRPLTTDAQRGGTLHGLWIPGSRVKGAVREGGVAYRSGADYAAALTSGIVGLLLGAQLRNGMSANPRAAREAMLKTATPRIASRAGEPRAMTGRAQIQASLDRMLGQVGRIRGTTTFPPFTNGLTASGLDGRG